MRILNIKKNNNNCKESKPQKESHFDFSTVVGYFHFSDNVLSLMLSPK